MRSLRKVRVMGRARASARARPRYRASARVRVRAHVSFRVTVRFKIGVECEETTCVALKHYAGEGLVDHCIKSFPDLRERHGAVGLHAVPDAWLGRWLALVATVALVVVLSTQ